MRKQLKIFRWTIVLNIVSKPKPKKKNKIVTSTKGAKILSRRKILEDIRELQNKS